MQATITQHQFAGARARGFSLVELITTVSIVAVLATIATPSMAALVMRHRVQDATSALFAALIKTRSQALMLNTDVRLEPVGAGWAGGWRIPDPTAAGKYSDVHEPVESVDIAMSGASTIAYQYNGRIRGGVGVRFNLSGNAGGATTSACVAVDPSGRPYAQDRPC